MSGNCKTGLSKEHRESCVAMMDSETIGLPQNRDMLISHLLSPYNPLGELFDFDSHLILHSLITHIQAVGS